MHYYWIMRKKQYPHRLFKKIHIEMKYRKGRKKCVIYSKIFLAGVVDICKTYKS